VAVLSGASQRETLEDAIARAHAYHAHLTIVIAMPVVWPITDLFGVSSAVIGQDLERGALAELRQMLAGVPAEMPITALVHRGDASRLVVEIVESSDGVVVASTAPRHRRLNRRLRRRLGSERVVAAQPSLATEAA
jgi:hypothetical protein